MSGGGRHACGEPFVPRASGRRRAVRPPADARPDELPGEGGFATAADRVDWLAGHGLVAGFVVLVALLLAAVPGWQAPLHAWLALGMLVAALQAALALARAAGAAWRRQWGRNVWIGATGCVHFWTPAWLCQAARTGRWCLVRRLKESTTLSTGVPPRSRHLATPKR